MINKLLLFSMTIFLTIACVGGDPLDTPEISTKPRTSGFSQAPAFWGNNYFPHNLGISRDFDNQEIATIEDMQQEWVIATDNEKIFFTDSADLLDNKDTGDLSSYNDSEQGIYISYDWFETIPSYVLAVTQYFGYRRNVGSSNEYIELIHGDIIFNYRDHIFTSDSTPGSYDMPSVMLHELGHFLGLNHQFNYDIPSVMHPSIGVNTEKRDLFSYDIDAIKINYGLNTGLISEQTLPNLGKIDPEANAPNEGELVRGVHYLTNKGQCLHEINGQIVHTH